MKCYQVQITQHAQQDLQDIFYYIYNELQSPNTALNQLNRLETAILSLSHLPNKYRRYEEEPWLSRNLRILPVDNYVAFYIPNSQNMTVTVIRVLYGGKNIRRELNRFTEFEE